VFEPLLVDDADAAEVASKVAELLRARPEGWKLAGTVVPIAYTAWSLWLLAAGVVLLT